MSNINDLKKEFLKSQIEEAKKRELRINDGNKENKIDIELAIKKAYTDSQPRTIKDHGKIKNKKDIFDKLYIIMSKEKIFDSKNEFENQEEFNEMHHRICKEFLDEYNNILTSHGCDEQQYGKAQKIVNMTFKYLSCYKDADNYSNIFRYCHMALDSYTLGWFSNKVLDNSYKDNNELKKKINAWTKLEYDELSEGTYGWIQEKIRGFANTDEWEYRYDNGKKMTVFDAEFVIWEQEGLKRRKNELLKSIKNLSTMDMMHEFISYFGKTEISYEDIEMAIKNLEELKNNIK